MKLLIVEDEEKVAKNLKTGLEAEAYIVTTAATGEDGFFQASSATFDLIILDLMLPGRSGLEILQTLRKRGVQTPVLVLTAKDRLEDKIEGLNQGADDYLIKPFAYAELVARIRALLRRGRSDQILRLKCADLEMDLVTRKVLRNALPLELTQREFELLEYLLRNQSQVVTREMLGRDIWNEPDRSGTLDNVIDVHVARLRKKVDTDGVTKLIKTIRGVGFSLREGAA